MNILVVNWRCIKNPEMGGAEIHLHEIFKRIVEKGHSVTLVAHKFHNSKEEETVDGIKIIRHGNKYFFNRQFKRFYNTKLNQQPFDLVVDDISKIPLFTPKYIKKPIVGILHHIHGNSLYKEISLPLAYYIVKKEKQIPKKYPNTPIFTVSESTQSELVDLGFNKDLTSLLHNAINHDLYNNAAPKKNATPLLVYVGRIKKYKNIHLVIEAMSDLIKQFPDIKFVIGGKGDYLENLNDITAKHNLDNYVQFLGFLTEDAKADLLGKAWIFTTMPEKEGWGITIIEANAMKTPAVGSDVPGLRDSIKNNETGYLVQLGNKYQLVEKISNLLKDKNELTRLSENAYNWSNQFDWDKSADHFLQQVGVWYPQLKSKI